MKDDQRAINSLAEAVKDSLSIIESGIKAYVFQRDDPSYRQVATELRKLLTDRNAASSFAKSISRAKKSKNIFELRYGSGRHILVKSFRQSNVSSTGSYADVTPDIYPTRQDILHAAVHSGDPVPLRAWLDEELAYGRSGGIWKVNTVIKHIAGNEGSHIINPVGDPREDVAVAFFPRRPSPIELEETDFNQFNPWRQFVIAAGMKLLEAKFANGPRLVEHTIDVPTARRDERTLRIQKRFH